MTREEYDNLVDEAYEYDEIKNDVNIILNEPEKNLYFHLTNYVSDPPNNLSYINISEYENKIKQKFDSNILLLKVDIKRNDTQSTQVEYQFYNPNLITQKINLANILSKRRLDNDDENINNNDNNEVLIRIDLPVNWTKDQIEKINYLDSQNINAFNSSSDFYLDNCNQFTSSKGNDVFLKERKKIYYPDIPFCENDCSFIGYNPDTHKVTCQCNYKTNTDNYKDVTFNNNPIDSKFLKNLFLENMQSMKCIKVIFKWENLKTNAGFFIMIIFLVIFTISFIFYYLSGGFSQIESFINKALNDTNLHDIIERIIKIEPKQSGKKGENGEVIIPEDINVNKKNKMDENNLKDHPDDDPNPGNKNFNDDDINISDKEKEDNGREHNNGNEIDNDNNKDINSEGKKEEKKNEYNLIDIDDKGSKDKELK